MRTLCQQPAFPAQLAASVWPSRSPLPSSCLTASHAAAFCFASSRLPYAIPSWCHFDRNAQATEAATKDLAARTGLQVESPAPLFKQRRGCWQCQRPGYGRAGCNNTTPPFRHASAHPPALGGHGCWATLAPGSETLGIMRKDASTRMARAYHDAASNQYHNLLSSMAKPAALKLSSPASLASPKHSKVPGLLRTPVFPHTPATWHWP